MSKSGEYEFIENHSKNNLKNGRTAEVALEKMKKGYDSLFREVVSKGINGEISQNDMTDLLNSQKQINEISDKITRYNENFQSKTKQNESNRLSESEKQKIYHYSQTGDFNQDQIAKMFNTTQATVSRTLKNINNEK